MDRNKVFCAQYSPVIAVALRKESVDRNLWWGVRKAVGSLVALRKESVDRNLGFVHVLEGSIRSLSARRAWIEIGGCLWAPGINLSLSARRAWIEIRCRYRSTRHFWSLSARRAWIEIALVETALRAVYRRSPQGERG